MSDNTTERATDTLRGSLQHAWVTFNNQNSVLMSMRVPEKQLLCLLHDNRIFSFDQRASDLAEVSASSSSSEQNVMLNLLTTPKYRAMGAMYMLFRLLDNLGLLAIIVLSITTGSIYLPSAADMAIVSAIGLEVFYDVILMTSKYWILHRLSIYIGLILFASYSFILVEKFNSGLQMDQTIRIALILAARFVAFVLEECVDIAIDGELHNDLLRLRALKPSACESGVMYEPVDMEDVGLWTKFKQYLDVTNFVKMPHNVHYKGSFSAWSPSSVFTDDIWKEDKFSRCLVVVLCFVPGFITICMVVLLLLVCIVAASIPILGIFLALCCAFGTCRPKAIKASIQKSLKIRNFWKELRNF